MKVFVLGGNGMAGHVLRYYFSKLTYELIYSVREQTDDPRAIKLDLLDETATYQCLQEIRPDIVINATAILNDNTAKNMKEAIYINSFLPHLLAEYGERLGFKLIHISSDGVFSGKKGNYRENDEKDAISIYAMTKNLGEVIDDCNVTIRTSIIGPEIRMQGIGIFHWFMNQSGNIQGFKEVYWNGITTVELAKAIDWIIQKNICGIVHLAASHRISKYDLLVMFKETFKRNDITIIPNDLMKTDKTLFNTRDDFSFYTSDYHEMMAGLKQWMMEYSHLYTHYDLLHSVEGKGGA